jgi:hypothetical protein
MTRFEPDTLLQALARPFDMVAPDANVYFEIPAPDVRFAAIVLLAGLALLLWRRLGPGRSATFAMLALLFASAAVWLCTSGNGRYFMPMLVAAGPLAVALICLLPATRMLKASLVVLLVAAQAFVFSQQPPWRSWSLLRWADPPYFDVRLGPQERNGPPTTYASMSLLTHSIIAPQFPASSRWINLVASSGTPRDRAWTDEFLRKAAAEGPLKVVAPSIEWASLPDGRPTAEIVRALNMLVARRNLRIEGSCTHVASPGLLRMAQEEKKVQEGSPVQLGFWLCPAVYVPGLATSVPEHEPPAAVKKTFARLGELCPGVFPDGETSLARLPDGWSRRYASDTRAYVLDNGQVWYHFWRALNPVLVGNTKDLLSGAVRIDCAAVRNDGGWKTGAQ